jgi:membrane-associated phospholipid phosphatase
VRDEIAPRACRVCGTNALDDWGRERLAWDSHRGPRLSSHALAYALLPAAVATHALLVARGSGDLDAGLVDVLLIAEASAIALNVNTLVKYAVARERPGRGDVDRFRSDDNLSFPSGHTTLAFALVSSAATVAQLRGYRTSPWVWAAGMVLAGGVGYLRVAADAHHLTDVATGAALGTAIGVAVPRLFHGREERRVAIVPVAPLGIAVAF